MNAILLTGHLAAFLAAPVVIGGFAAALARLVWRAELAAAGVLRLWLWASTACAAAAAGGLIVFGRDGRMATYAAMVLACAAALWWRGFRRPRR